MITLDVPPKLILPDYYQSNRPAIIRPGVDLANFFPVEIDRKTRRAIVSKLAKLGLIDDRAEAVKLVDAAIPFGMFKPNSVTVGPNARTYLGSNNSSTSTTTYTYNSQTLGSASDDRYIVVLWGAGGGTAAAPTSITVAGITATPLIYDVNTNHDCGISIALVPTGTSGSIVFTWAASRARMGFGYYLLTGLASTVAVDDGSDPGVDPASVTVATDADGSIFATSANNDGSVVWTNVTERYDVNVASQSGFSGADADGTGSNVTVSCAFNGPTRRVAAVVSLR